MKEVFPAYHRTQPLVSAKKCLANSADKSTMGTSIEVATIVETPLVDTTTTIVVEVENPINLLYMSNTLRMFRFFPTFKHPSNYISWLEKVEWKKSQVWKYLGIYDLIQLSKVGPSYYQSMMVASLYFWESTTNNFHLPRGMMTPTLFDLATIIGLQPTGKALDPNISNENAINFDHNKASFGRYINDHHDTASDEVSDTEHITFLALWLSRCCFLFKIH